MPLVSLSLKQETAPRDLLHLAHDFLSSAQALDHLLAFLPPSNGVVALLEQIVDFLSAIHLFEQFALHFFFGMSVVHVSIRRSFKAESRDTHSTRFNMIALGTMSIIVLRTMLK